jgi:putative ABC transport system permease protein
VTGYTPGGGRRIELRIVGIALSPTVMNPPAGLRRTTGAGVFWMGGSTCRVARPARLRQHVAVRLAPGGSEAGVIAGLDRLLDQYGGRGAFGRTSQRSHVELENHIDQLRGLSLVVPAIFLVVAAFLVNIVLGRLVGTQRGQIGMLKAFGYSNARLAGHYLTLALAVVRRASSSALHSASGSVA